LLGAYCLKKVFAGGEDQKGLLQGLLNELNAAAKAKPQKKDSKERPILSREDRDAKFVAEAIEGLKFYQAIYQRKIEAARAKTAKK